MPNDMTRNILGLYRSHGPEIEDLLQDYPLRRMINRRWLFVFHIWRTKFKTL